MIDIYIVGLGVLNVDQITRETERAIRRSKEVLYLDTGVATRACLEQLCHKVTSLYESSYRESDHRMNAYHHMAARVLDAALDHPPVTFAMHGHPLVGAYAPFLMIDMANVLELEVRILPGISAMDSIFAELAIDPCVTGMQMYEATDLLLRRRPLQSDVPALIWQIGTVETALHSTRPSRPNRFRRLQTHLLRFYPPKHHASAVYSTPHPLMPTTIHRFALEDLSEQAHVLHAGFTLYIPPSADRPIKDHHLLNQISSPTHLKNITR